MEETLQGHSLQGRMSWESQRSVSVSVFVKKPAQRWLRECYTVDRWHENRDRTSRKKNRDNDEDQWFDEIAAHRHLDNLHVHGAIKYIDGNCNSWHSIHDARWAAGKWSRDDLDKRCKWYKWSVAGIIGVATPRVRARK